MFINLLYLLSTIPVVGFPFRMLLVAITGESRHMPNERGAVVPRKLLIGRIIRTLCFLLFVAVAIAGYQLLKHGKGNRSAEGRDTDNASFASSVSIKDANELDRLYHRLQFAPEDSLTIRIDKLRQRIKIGENMSASRDEATRVKGEYYAIVSLNSVALTYLQVDEPVDKTTRLALAEHIQSDSEDKATKLHIAVARVLVELNIMLHGQQEAKAENQFASYFEEAASLASSDFLAASTLFQIVKLLESQPANSDMAQATEHGYRSLARNLAASESQTIAELGKRSHKLSVITYDLSIPTIEQGAERSFQQKQINEASQQIKKFVGKGNVEMFAWQPITETIDTFLRTGHVQSAIALIEFCDDKFRSDNPDTAEKFAALSKWVAQFGKEFKPQSLRDVEDNQVGVGDAGRCRVLIFAAPDTTTLTGEKLDPILKLGKEKIKSLGITISIVYCGDDINQDIERNYLVGQQEMATKSDFLDVWIVDTTNNTDFFSNYPMVDRPFVLMLDRTKRIAAVDPTPFEFDRQVSLLTRAETQSQK